MAKKNQMIFLEEWLKSNDGSGSNTTARNSSSSSARAIIQAWADLRNCLEHLSFNLHHLQSLRTLLNSQLSLYVADPQAKLLLSILSTPDLLLPHESYPLFIRLLYIWIRKSSRASSVVVDTAVEVLCHIFTATFSACKSSFFFAEGVLLLGALSFSTSVSEKSRVFCLELLCRLLEEEYRLIGSSEGLIPSILAGIGYALSSSENLYFVRILDPLFGIWNKQDGPHASVSSGLMILHLIEWVLSNFITSHSSEKIDLFTQEILETRKPTYASFSVIMAAAGALRASNRSVSIGMSHLRRAAEGQIESVASELVSKVQNFTAFNDQRTDSLLLQCISLALVRSGSISSRPALLVCLASALLLEIFPLPWFYARILGHSPGSLGILGPSEVKYHLDSAVFKEAGAITRVFCNQYTPADEGSKRVVENLIWDYCKDVYSYHRQVSLILRDEENEFFMDLEKIAESCFLMVVVFANAVSKYSLASNTNQKSQLETSVKILVSFSCMEYFRRMRLPEYMDTIRGVVVSIQENESACVCFAESIPSYAKLTNLQGLSSLQQKAYVWCKDEVQTARILFYLRVIPTCIERLPAPIFRKVLVPIMFLYMGYPNGKVARASHSVFVAFISSVKESGEDERVLLKEQLVFYYMQRSLEGCPGVTPFEGLASGVAAIVRHLPAGSPSIFYCVHSLVEKVNSLCSKFMTQEGDMWKSWQGELEPARKVMELLLRLLSMVDVQVLPSLMKSLAQLTMRLPKDGQNFVLNELYALVAESDDVTRKPTLVSWLQSLSYLCSKEASRNTSNNTATKAWSMSNFGLDRITARL